MKPFYCLSCKHRKFDLFGFPMCDKEKRDIATILGMTPSWCPLREEESKPITPAQESDFQEQKMSVYLEMKNQFEKSVEKERQRQELASSPLLTIAQANNKSGTMQELEENYNRIVELLKNKP